MTTTTTYKGLKAERNEIQEMPRGQERNDAKRAWRAAYNVRHGIRPACDNGYAVVTFDRSDARNEAMMNALAEAQGTGKSEQARISRMFGGR